MWDRRIKYSLPLFLSTEFSCPPNKEKMEITTLFHFSVFSISIFHPKQIDPLCFQFCYWLQPNPQLIVKRRRMRSEKKKKYIYIYINNEKWRIRLDRLCATLEWRELFPQAKVRHLQAAYSDHDSILLSTQETGLISRRKKIPKRFEEKRSTHPECENIILEAWNRETNSGSPMYRLFNKIRQCL